MEKSMEIEVEIPDFELTDGGCELLANLFVLIKI